MTPKRYFLLTLTASLVLVASAYGLAWWLQPLYGDLTRIGGHSERDFGWNEPMLEFQPLLSSYGAWETPVDILVLGDSFANLRPHQQWQNWLAKKTGWRIHTLDKHLVDLGQLTTSKLYQDHPPRVVIWNNIERDLKNEYSATIDQCKTNARFVGVPLQINARRYSPHILEIRRSQSLSELNPGFSRLWLLRSIGRWGGLETSDTNKAQLTRSDLFSNRRNSQVLVYSKDFGKKSWTPKDLSKIRCGYSQLAKIFEANGKTRFVTALAPDKSSAYHPWLVNSDGLPKSHLAQLLREFPVPDARLDIAIAQAIADGTRDVYMPDDTHWGSAGQRLAAEAIFTMLTAEGLAR